MNKWIVDSTCFVVFFVFWATEKYWDVWSQVWILTCDCLSPTYGHSTGFQFTWFLFFQPSFLFQKVSKLHRTTKSNRYLRILPQETLRWSINLFFGCFLGFVLIHWFCCCFYFLRLSLICMLVWTLRNIFAHIWEDQNKIEDDCHLVRERKQYKS